MDQVHFSEQSCCDKTKFVFATEWTFLETGQ